MDSAEKKVGLQILLVEDNRHDRLAFCRALKKSRLDAHITELPGAEQALALLQEKPDQFDILVTDNKMIGMTGLDLCKQLADRQKNLPIVMLTGTGTEYLAVEALKAGASDYIIKDADSGYLDLLAFKLMDVLKHHRDHSARVHAEAALRESEERFRLALDAAQQGLWEQNFGRYPDFFSDRMFTMLGYEPVPPGLADDFFQHLVHPEDVKAYQKAQQDLHFHGQDECTAEFRLRAGDGTWRHILCKAKCIARDNQGRTVRVIGTHADVTEKKQVEEKIRRINENLERRVAERTATLESQALELVLAKQAAEAANIAKSKFLANMSHELRTPLNAIMGFAQILRKDPNLADQQKNQMDIIYSSGEHLVALISDIIEIARIDTHKEIVQPTVFNLQGLIQAACSAAKEKTSEKNLSFYYEELTQLPTCVTGDYRMLLQVLNKLLDNAIKFTKHGSVTLRASAVPSDLQLIVGKKAWRVCLEVDDTGTGMPDEIIGDIFNPFYQGERKDLLIEGTGLGLTISKRLVELMGGEITVKSRLGKGSCFAVNLALPAAKSDATKAEEACETNFSTKRVLIVDDN